MGISKTGYDRFSIFFGSCRFRGQLAMDIDWPRTIGHVLWPMSMCYGQCPCLMANVHVTWPMSMKYFVFKFCGKIVQEYFSLSLEINVHEHLLVKNRINTII